jgi:hypothetical protein
MKITKENYYDTIEKYGISTFSPITQKGHEFINRATNNGKDWSNYNMYQKAIDNQFTILASDIEKMGVSQNTLKQKVAFKREQPKPKMSANTQNPVNTSPQTNQKKSEELDDSSEDYSTQQVEYISPELGFIKRYLSFHTKTKTKEQISSFIRSLQKAIYERRIKKTAPFAKLISFIQSDLIAKFEKKGDNITFKLEDAILKKLANAIQTESILPSVKFIKSYVGLLGKAITKEKATNLLNRIITSADKNLITPNDKYANKIELIVKSLSNFLNKSKNKNASVNSKLDISQAELNGLEGVLKACGCHTTNNSTQTIKSGLNGLGYILNTKDKQAKRIMNSVDFTKLKFERIGFTGKWLGFIGNPCKGFTVMVSAKPKYGKSNLCLQFAGYLSKNHGRSLYVAVEESLDYTLQEKIVQQAVDNPNLDLSNYLPNDLTPYENVFIDSVTTVNLSPQDLTELEQSNPLKNFIYVHQTTKEGAHRGTNEFKHNVDSVIEIPEIGKAIQYGRFNQGGTLDIFENTN